MKEIWIDIIGYEHIYKISSLGKIIKLYNGKIKEINPVLNDGYLRVGLTKNKCRKKYLLHRLILIHFGGHKPLNKDCVLHNDGNSLNNTLSNLRWGTNKENSEDTVKHGKSKTINRSGESNINCKLNHQLVSDIRQLYKNGKKQVYLCKAYDIPKSTMHFIIKNKTWSFL